MEDLAKLIEENRKILGNSQLIESMVKNPIFWKRFLIKTLPQGKGSGLDADTVDGYHADDFLQRLAVKHLAMGGGASKFISLTDVPNSYVGESGKFAKVKATEDGLEFGVGEGGVTKHIDLTDKEILGVIDHADESITMAKLITAVQDLINGALQAAAHDKALHDALGIDAATLEGSNKATVQDHTPKAHTLASHSTKAHSELSDAPADAHHPSGNILDSVLGLKTGIKAGTNITIVNDAGYAKIAASGGGGICSIASDYPDIAITETSETSQYLYYFIRDATLGTNFGTLFILAEGYAQTSYNLQLKVYLDGTLRITLTWTETSATIKTGSYDISGWADGKHTIEVKKIVSGGTGHLTMFENWVKT